MTEEFQTRAPQVTPPAAAAGGAGLPEAETPRAPAVSGEDAQDAAPAPEGGTQAGGSAPDAPAAGGPGAPETDARTGAGQAQRRVGERRRPGLSAPRRPLAAGPRERAPALSEPGLRESGLRESGLREPGLREPGARRNVAMRGALIAILILAAATLWITNGWLTERFTESTRTRTEVRLALYSGNILSELQRTAVVPRFLANDPVLLRSLADGEYSATSARLIEAKQEISAASFRLLDTSGRVVAATDRSQLGTAFAQAQWFVDAMRSRETIFTAAPRETGGTEFVYSRAMIDEGRVLGVIVVEADLAALERSWAGVSEAVAVTDSEGRIILASEPRWRGLTVVEALAVRSAPSAIRRALQATADWANEPPDAYLRGTAVMRTESRIPFRGWRMVSFTTYDSVRERVNAVLALEIMGFAILLALAFYWLSRRERVKSLAYRRESAELRALNARLSREVAERERVQQTLAVAEQTLAQSSKLAALGEMSAAVSHELNQPLAAMKTYLAGARLLLQRQRGEEALASFQRIDDLIERMGAITRQLKSYARKGGEAFEPVDLRAAVSSALAMMEPQLRARTVRISRLLPREPVRVMADRIRLEQVIINLLRNALDATKPVAAPQIEILLTAGDMAVLSLRDNGEGISDLEKLFEPFWTTKKPGEGTGLGLAISSSIVTDFGGRLTARNAEGGGAVFEMKLPLHSEGAEGRTPARAAE